MVYKKIMGRVPSLSSLLLAGMVLGSCEPKGKKQEAGGDGAQSQGPQGPVVGTSPSHTMVSREKGQACWQVWREIFNLKQHVLSYLERSGALVLKEKDYTCTGELAKTNVEGLCVNLAEGPYPRDPQEASFVHLKGLKFGSKPGDVTIRRYTANKALWGAALNQFAIVRAKFAEVYAKIKKMEAESRNDPARKLLEMKSLSDQFKEFYNQSIKGKFTASTTFLNPDSQKKPYLYESGGELAEFLREDQADKGAFDIMAENMGNVLILKQHQDHACKDFINNAPTGDILLPRGAGIPPTWKINKHIRMFDRLGIHNDHGAVQPNGAAWFDLLEFSQLFFGFFQGKLNNEVDIFEISKKLNDDVEFKASNDAFSKLVEQAAKDDDSFAQYLGSHMDNNDDLKKIFAIADLDELIEKIVKPMQRSGDSVPNLAGTPETPGGPPATASVGAGSFTEHLFRTIVTGANNNQCNSSEQVLVADMQAAANANNYQNKTFYQIACMRLAEVIMNTPQYKEVCLANSNRKVSEVVQFISEKIENQLAKDVILKKIHSKYASTTLTDQFKQQVLNLEKRLKERQKIEDSISYGKIEQDAPGFKIQPVREWIEEHYKLLEYLLEVPDTLLPVLDQQGEAGTVNYASKLNDSQLVGNATDALDQIRLGYQDKIKPQVLITPADQAVAAGR